VAVTYFALKNPAWVTALDAKVPHPTTLMKLTTR
jgi:hypothetical protein